MTDAEYDDELVAMQPRCIHCLGENYALNVPDYSHGDSPCHKCGRHSRQMTRTEYRQALNAAYERRQPTPPQIPWPRRPTANP